MISELSSDKLFQRITSHRIPTTVSFKLVFGGFFSPLVFCALKCPNISYSHEALN